MLSRRKKPSCLKGARQLVPPRANGRRACACHGHGSCRENGQHRPTQPYHHEGVRCRCVCGIGDDGLVVLDGGLVLWVAASRAQSATAFFPPERTIRSPLGRVLVEPLGLPRHELRLLLLLPLYRLIGGGDDPSSAMGFFGPPAMEEGVEEEGEFMEREG